MHLPLFEPHHASEADRRVCQQLIQVGSRSFFAASLLLPADVRDAAYALYAFCRLSDDLVDVEGGSLEATRQLRGRLDRVYAGCPDDLPVDRAFADVVRHHGLPRALPDALIDGLEWDIGQVVCETLADLQAYAARVAGSVGAMMTVLMGVDDPATLARACDLGVAMQLTNIARDVGEDARAGRLYLPRDWLRAEGIDGDLWLQAPRFEPGIARVVERLLRAADVLYARAATGICGLPGRCRPAIFAALHLYRAIGREVERRGYDCVTVRARVSGAQKIGLMLAGLFDAVTVAGRPLAAPPLAETAYLVEAVAGREPLRRAGTPSLGPFSDRIIWVAELFASLEARASAPARHGQ